VDRLDDEAFVREQYRTTERLATRISVWQPGPDGVSPQDVAVAALAEVRPARLLEVGCGTGALAERCAAELRCEIVALDASPEMARATAARGLDAREGDVQALPFPDGAFDCALAAWMLYHVSDLGLAIAELARVLGPGGRLVAITNSRDHLAGLYAAVGAAKLDSSFTAENGTDLLARHFARVERRDVAARAVFRDRAQAAANLTSLGRAGLAERLPGEPWPLLAESTTAVFVADARRDGQLTRPTAATA
jgi:SAM-dependent methyltransferase